MDDTIKGRLLLAVWIAVVAALLAGMGGCAGRENYGGQMQTYYAPAQEADWIRNGEPIEFENELWYPVDDVEVLRDSEMIPMGTYRGVQFFIEKVDVRPLARLYTKFGNHQYRFFVRRHD